MIYTILYIIIRHLARALPFATLSVMLSLTRYCMPNNFISPFCPPHCPLLRYVFDTLYLPHVDRAFPNVLSWSFTVSHSTLCLLKQFLIEAMEPVKQPESQDSQKQRPPINQQNQLILLELHPHQHLLLQSPSPLKKLHYWGNLDLPEKHLKQRSPWESRVGMNIYKYLQPET